jgi:hypothetical protein
MEKFHNIYKKSVDDKMPIQKIGTNMESYNIRELSGNEIRDYLTVDEKRVLKEVFGDLNVDKNTTTPYSQMRYSEFLKGTQLDVRL